MKNLEDIVVLERLFHSAQCTLTREDFPCLPLLIYVEVTGTVFII